MQKFPTINVEQVALMRAEKNTGIVLDEKFARSISDTQIVYTVFPNFDAAVKYEENINKERDDVEFVIYDNSQKVLKCSS